MKKLWVIPLLCGGLSMPSVTLSSPIEPGFDLLVTKPFDPVKEKGTYIDFSPFGGPSRIWLNGHPALLASEKVGPTDTIVERKQGSTPNFDFPNGEVTVEIELIALSLKSIDSFDVEFLGFSSETMADLYVVVNARELSDFPPLNPHLELTSTGNIMVEKPLPPSTGKMTIRYEETDSKNYQGTFDSQLNVYSYLIFVRAGGDLDNSEDWLFPIPVADPLTLSMPAETELTGSGKWSHIPPPYLSRRHNDKYPAGNFYVIGILKELAKWLAHILPVTLDYFTATTKNSVVSLEWGTGTEKDNAGFFVWRGQPVDGKCSDNPDNYADIRKMTPLVASQGTEVSGATYTMIDSNVVSGNTYCYALEDRDFSGESTFHLNDIVSATP